MTSELQYAPQLEQTNLAEYWFRLNFVPFEGDVGGAGYGVSSAGSGGYAPGHMLPGAYLSDEFADVLPSSVIENVSVRLQREATWWIPAPPESLPSQDSDLARAARVALERVEAYLARVGPGHNQGPPLDPAIAAEIREQVRSALQAVETGTEGKDAASASASKLKALAKFVGDAAAKVVVGEQVKEWLPGVKHFLADLCDHMLQAASALLHWIASTPPGPLL